MKTSTEVLLVFLVCTIIFTVIVVFSMRLLKESDMDLDASMKKEYYSTDPAPPRFNEHMTKNNL